MNLNKVASSQVGTKVKYINRDISEYSKQALRYMLIYKQWSTSVEKNGGDSSASRIAFEKMANMARYFQYSKQGGKCEIGETIARRFTEEEIKNTLYKNKSGV